MFTAKFELNSGDQIVVALRITMPQHIAKEDINQNISGLIKNIENQPRLVSIIL